MSLSDFDCYGNVKLMLPKESLGINAIYLCKIMAITG